MYLENIVYHNFRHLWLVLGVKLLDIKSNLFSRSRLSNFFILHADKPQLQPTISTTTNLGSTPCWWIICQDSPHKTSVWIECLAFCLWQISLLQWNIFHLSSSTAFVVSRCLPRSVSSSVSRRKSSTSVRIEAPTTRTRDSARVYPQLSNSGT